MSSESDPGATRRERRLWTLTAVAAVGIYSTLGLARTMAGVLRDRGMLDAVFVVGFVAILVAIAVVGLRSRPGAGEIGVALAVVAVYLMLFARLGIPEERTHLFEYSVVALLIHEALRERSMRRPVWRPALLAIAAASLVGTIDELIQLAIPSRVFDPVDIGFNILAAVVAVVGSVALRRVRGVTQSSR